MNKSVLDQLEDKIESMPPTSGVYLMKNEAGHVLYVGKAKNLRSRVRSYFRSSGDGRYRIRFLIPHVTDLEFIVTDTEKEALLLENNLLKKFRPKYNVNFRDDKNYISLKLNLKDLYPRLQIVRKIEKEEDCLYFGPYSSSKAVKETLRFVYSLFPLRLCSDTIFKSRTRPCLYCQIGKCSGPCREGNISAEVYQEHVKQLIMFLQGRSEELIAELEKKVKEESRQLRFENAAQIYRKLLAIKKTTEKQKVTSIDFTDRDVFGLYREGERVGVQLLSIRGGKLIGSNFDMFDHQLLPDEEILESYIVQYYAEGSFVPEEILLPCFLEGEVPLADILSERRGNRLIILVPQRGEKRQLLLMAQKNAELSFHQYKQKSEEISANLAEIQQRLYLANFPQTIECVDISNIMGTQAVGSLVRFSDGLPDKRGYRIFKIKSVFQSDDYAMIREVFQRHYKRVLEHGELPDLIMVDGGKGQLNAALEVIKELNIEGVDLTGIAKTREREFSRGKKEKGRVDKTEERFFIPYRKNPILFPRNSSALFLLERIRNEAHRVAISRHQNLRQRQVLKSQLEEIPGVGPKRKNYLLNHFGSVKKVKEASIEELLQVPSFNQDLARKVYEFFHGQK